jgi:hypothetical protein
MHLVIEASDKRALSAGLRSLVIRVARYVNDLLGRRGRFWADRWHGRDLTTPRQVRTALVYVLANFRKHSRKRPRKGADAFSSALGFDGWRGCSLGSALPRAGPPFHRALARHVVVSTPRTWLGAAAWRRFGLIRVDEAPSPVSRGTASRTLPA